jgi:hypothetical protein
VFSPQKREKQSDLAANKAKTHQNIRIYDQNRLRKAISHGKGN